MFGAVTPVALGTNIINAIISQSIFWMLSWIALVGFGIYSQLALSKEYGREVADYDNTSYGYGSLAGSKGGATKSTTEEGEVVEDKPRDTTYSS
jgi:hypothetical protein